MGGSLVTLVGRSHVPNVRLEGIAAGADAHFGEVADSVFGFGKGWMESISGVCGGGKGEMKAMGKQERERGGDAEGGQRGKKGMDEGRKRDERIKR